jgi:hypothetical protein
MDNLNAPTIYHYRSGTFELGGVGKASPDPLTPGSWLYPAYSTQIVPPKAAVREVAVFNPSQQVWSLRPDWRTVSLWSIKTAWRIWEVQIGDTPESLQATPLQPPVQFPIWLGESWGVDQVALEKFSRAELQRRMDEGLLKRRLLIDAMELDLASPSECTNLAAWSDYCVALSHVSGQTGWPNLDKLVWPKQPAEDWK